MPLIPSVRAVLAERFILNFRMPVDAMKRFLPVPWLEPAVVNDYAIASFCMLDLRNITVAPLPALAGLSSLSCAPRYAVIDTSVSPARPAVFVTERFTNSSFGAWFTSLGFSAPHPYVEAHVAKTPDASALTVNEGDRVLFAARVTDAAEVQKNSVFTTDSFTRFIAEGVSSYGTSIHGSRLTKVDLHKADGTYEPLRVLSFGGPAVDPWIDAGAELDSAFRTHGGRYEWTYLGLTPEAAG